MSALSNYLENKLLDHVFRGTSFSAPATLYFALFTVAPTDAGGGTEVSGGAYARVAKTANLTNFSGTQALLSTVASSGTSGTIYNNNDIIFPDPVGANWGTITYMGIFDASTAGNLLCYGQVLPNKTVNNGDAPPKFNVSAWSMQLDTE